MLTATSCGATGASTRDRLAAVLQRVLGGLDHADDVERQLELCRRAGSPVSHRVDEVLELDRQRLAAVEVRGDDVAGAVGEVILAERLGSS